MKNQHLHKRGLKKEWSNPLFSQASDWSTIWNPEGPTLHIETTKTQVRKISKTPSITTIQHLPQTEIQLAKNEGKKISPLQFGELRRSTAEDLGKPPRTLSVFQGARSADPSKQEKWKRDGLFVNGLCLLPLLFVGEVDEIAEEKWMGCFERE